MKKTTLFAGIAAVLRFGVIADRRDGCCASDRYPVPAEIQIGSPRR